MRKPFYIAVASLAAACSLAASERPRRDERPSWSAKTGVDLRAGADARLLSRNRANFEGGNIGKVVKLTPHDYELDLRNDNDEALPLFWRQWWFAEVDGLPTDAPVTFTLKGQGFSSAYVPAYSYDNETWELFDWSSVKKPSQQTLRFSKRFRQPKVYLARWVPYTYSKLLGYVDKLKSDPSVTASDIGTTEHGRRIPFLELTDKSAPAAAKSRVVIHARTHPGEVGSNFLLEGLLDFVRSRDPLAAKMRRKLVFDVVPMLNVDGVVCGNNRVTPGGVNLEGMWRTQPGKPFLLDPAKAPKEVRLLHAKYAALAQEGPPVTVALNLHSSNGEPDDNVFVFPHFGPQKLGYSAKEASLWQKQMRFIDEWRALQGKQWFNDPAVDGQRQFLAKMVPEAWWWRNFGDKVMAMTVESVYGHAGNSRRWVTPSDMRKIGVSLAKALAQYHGIK